jgi:hypothetical protein
MPWISFSFCIDGQILKLDPERITHDPALPHLFLSSFNIDKLYYRATRGCVLALEAIFVHVMGDEFSKTQWHAV